MSKVPAHPIALHSVQFIRTCVTTVPGFVPSDAPIEVAPQNSITVNPVEGEPGHFFAQMRTIVNPEANVSGPYSIDMECFALLAVDASLTEEEAQRGVTITAHSVLYGAIRETVAWLTGRQPFGSVLLGLSVLANSPAQSSADATTAKDS